LYTVSEKLKNKLTEQFFGEYCNDDETKETIKKVFEKYSYLVDTHTAVAVNVYEKYIKKTNDDTKTIIASTASPYKFSSSVLSAIDPSKLSDDEFEMVNILSKLTATEIPNSLAELKNKKVLHNQSCEKQNMKEFIFKKLGI
ncbi:MAG TPA: threonine synthase, partial [Ruminococcaceae bacterium]|nr:threonine synthase [Oscillospiraceae bacterium]